MTAGRGRVHMTLRLPDRTGAAKMALAFAQALHADRFDVTLVHGTVPASEPSILPDFAQLGAETVLEPRLERPWDPLLVRAVADRVRSEGGVCVIGVNQRDRMLALLAASRAGVPGVVVVGNQHRFWGSRPVAALKRLSYTRVVARHTTLAVCTSAVVRDELIAFGVPAERAVVLANGIDAPPSLQLPAGERRRLRAEMGAGDDDVLLLNVGRLDPQKGQDLLLTALGGQGWAAPVHVALVGSSGDPVAARATTAFEASLRRQADALGLEGVVSFLGWRSDVRQLLAAADGYVHAARWEGPALPLAVMEAMAAGLPTVFTDCSGMPPVFEEGRHGLVARSEDPESLAGRIGDLVALGAHRRADMGAEAAALIRTHYRMADVGQTFCRLIQGVVARRG
ncbi:glycosyltransferase family 4 protein [Geodermatophilus sabuli]|uniref:Glycosyltransferase family 4 protein n=1 Tax=Geodermatophilus sabuli TaxID=1564158 RepID=A0A7K3W532_9ACTN|nr:glycosyltransferase family 4 protein [Geodermatophilus sabuli]NEK59344.1 glycosyltransferase family 4 protein [Geodermatophilus sabuli]